MRSVFFSILKLDQDKDKIIDTWIDWIAHVLEIKSYK